MHLLVKYTLRTGFCTGSITIPRVFFSPVFSCVSAMQNPFLSWVPGGLTVVDRTFSVGYPCVCLSIIPCVLSYVFLRANLAYLCLLLTFSLCSLVFLPHKSPAFHHKLPARFPLFFPLFFLYNSPVLLFVFFYLSRVFSFMSSVLYSQYFRWVTRCLSCTFAVFSYVSREFRNSFLVLSSIPGVFLTHAFRFVFREFRLVFPLRFAVRNLCVSSSTS